MNVSSLGVLNSMSKRKRLSDILTPPTWLFPASKSDLPPAPDVIEANAGPSLAEIAPMLKELLQPGKLNEGEMRARLGRIKELSAKYGFVQVAREIRDTVDRLPETAADGAEYRKSRGYELACDLTIQHARSKLRVQEPAKVLPEVVAAASEVLESLFAAGKHVKAIELTIDLMDSVLERVCAGQGTCDEYLRTAQEIAAYALERSLVVDEASRKARMNSAQDGTVAGKDFVIVPAEALAQLAATCERVRGARRRMSSLERVADGAARMRFLQIVAEESAAANLWPLAATALEESATLIRAHNAGESDALAKRARAVCERAAAESDAAGFKQLAQRYRKRTGAAPA